MEHIKNLLAGMRQALTLTPEPRGYRIDNHGFRTDALRIAGDFSSVGKDMRTVLKNDKQANNRAR